jgi:HEAT repeat protein
MKGGPPRKKPGKKLSAPARLERAVMAGDALQKEKAINAILGSSSKGIVGELMGLLTNTDTNVRMNGLSLLKRVGGRNLSPVLDLLKATDPWMRMCACEILGEVKKKRVMPHLIACSQDPDPNVRNAACIALGAFRDDSAVDALLAALQDEEWIAFCAVHSLGKIGSDRAVPYLWKIFVEKDGVLALITCEVLLGFRRQQVWRDAFLVLKGWSEQKRDIFVRTVLEKEVPAVLDMLFDTMGESLFSHLARHVLADGKWSPRIMGLLARFRRPETCNILLDVLRTVDQDSEEFDDLLDIFVGLHEVWQYRSEEYLQKDPQELLPFIRACGMAGHKIPAETIDRLFMHAPLAVKRELMRQLPSIIDGDATGLMRKALTDEDGHIKGDAAIAAARLGLEGFTQEIVNISVDGFLDVRRKGLQALATLDKQRLGDLVETLARSARSDDRKTALTALNELDKERIFGVMQVLLNDPDESVVKSAIHTAGNMLPQDNRYLKALNELLAERPVVHELLRVIREQKLDIFKDPLVKLFGEQGDDAWTRYQVLTALAAFRDHSLLNVFVGALQDENILIKIGSIKALSDLADASVMVHVKPFMRSQDPALRSAASAAVKELRRLEQESSL